MDKKYELMQKLLNYWFVMDKLTQNAHPANEVREHSKYVRILEQKIKEGKQSSQDKKLSKTITVHAKFNPEDTTGIGTIITNELKTFNEYCEKFEPRFKYEAGSRISVFLGEVLREDILKNLSKKLNPSGKDETPEKMTEYITFALVSADHKGFYIEESLSLSPIVWCESVLTGKRDVNYLFLSSSEYRKVQKDLDEQCKGKPLSEVMDILAEKYDYHHPANSEYEYLLKFNLYKKEIKAEKDTSEENNNAENDTPEGEETERLGTSFYADDLEICMDMLKTGKLPDIVKNYLTAEYGFDKKPEGSIDLVNGSAEMLRRQFDTIMDIRKMPRGKWPSQYAPALMQQAAIDLETDRKGTGSIFSVNGPPGTGKTTLLKEIIVNNIVERAALIYKYTEGSEDPDTLFDSHRFKHGGVTTYKIKDKELSKTAYDYNTPFWYSIKQEFDDLNDYGVVVTSCNNTAVENISNELPKDDFTGLTALADYRKLCNEMNGDNDPEKVEKLYSGFCKAHGALSDKKNKSRFETDANYPAAVQLEERFGIPEGTSDEDSFFSIAELLSPVCTEKRLNVYLFGKDEKGKSELKPRLTADVYFSYFATSLLNKEKKDDEEKPQDKLFFADKTSVPKEVPKELAWGMIAAPLGKSRNISAFYYNALQPMLKLLEKCAKDKALHKDCLTQFCEARSAFKKQLDIVDRMQRELFEYAKTVSIREQSLSNGKNYMALMEETRGKAERAEKILADYANVDELLAHENKLRDELSQKKELSKDKAGIFSALKRRFDKKSSAEKQKLETEIDDINSQLDEIDKVKTAKEELIRANDEYEKLKNKYEAYLAKLKAEGWKRDGRAVLNGAFIQDYLDKENECCTIANVAELWATKEYDCEREKLFYLAMQLNKHTVLASKRIYNNLKTLAMYWGYMQAQTDESKDKKGKFKFGSDEADVVVPSLIQTLLLAVPVISTTFASVGRMFRNVKKPGVIGTLIVDEAGQATPECAVGALLRSRRAMIVGDPKQVEPVVTDDLKLIRDSYDDEQLEKYKRPGISVQVLADHLNKYGTMLKEDENDEDSAVWVGCPLVVHRRCLSPMFEISNDAYCNNMKNQTAPPKPEDERTFISESCWLDIDGKENGNKDHYVQEQGKRVAELIIKSFEINPSPSIFVISPFTTVVKGIRNEIKTMLKTLASTAPITDIWLEDNIGTVHKFQGKEAMEVFFLLGCDAQARGAIGWVNKNIINVAATRAKYRLYIVGHYKDVWENNDELKKAYREMEDFKIINLKSE